MQVANFSKEIWWWFSFILLDFISNIYAKGCLGKGK